MSRNKFIPVAEPDLRGNEKKYITECLSSSWISSKGKFIDRFEADFANFIGTKHAVSTSNGTTALHLALLVLGLGEGDEVIVPDLTFIASANTVTYTGAKPVFVDVESKTWNIDVKQVKEKITKKTKAIMPVHLYGHPANMEELSRLARKYNLLVIEDAAEAHGALVKTGGVWKRAGSVGRVGCFSFYGNKIITTGEGGMVTTDNPELANKMRILRDHGQNPKKRYYHDVIGFNYRMTNMQAAIGVAQFERIGDILKKKLEVAYMYNKLLSNIPGLTLPPCEEWAKSVYWMYSVLIDSPFPKSRDEMIQILAKENIETRPFFHPLHTMPPYLNRKKFPVTDYLSQKGMNLPSSTRLIEQDIKKVAQIFRKYST